MKAICPVSSLIQNSEITELSAMSASTALICSASMPALSAASMKWAVSMACATMCSEIPSSVSASSATTTPLASRHTAMHPMVNSLFMAPEVCVAADVASNQHAGSGINPT